MSSEVDFLNQKIDALTRRIERMERNPAPTIPSYDSTNFPQDAVTGQIAMDQNNSGWVYGEDQAWHQLAAAASSGIKWAYADVDNQTHPGGTGVTHVPDLTSFDTNSPADFALGTDSYGRGKQTIKFKTFGSYKVWIAAQFFSGTVGNRYTLYWDVGFVQSGFEAGSPDYIFKSSFTNITDFTELGKLASGDATLPTGASPWVQSHAAGSVIYYLQMYVEKIDDTVYIT